MHDTQGLLGPEQALQGQSPRRREGCIVDGALP